MFFDHAAPSAIGRFLLPYAFASAGVALAAILFIDEALGVLAPESYAGAASVVGILAVHYGLMFFGKQPQLVFAERTGLVSLLSVGTVVLNAAGIYVGAMCGGGLGVALGVLAAGIVSGAISLVLATRYAQIHYPVRHVVWVFAALPLAVLAVSRIRLSGWLTPIPELVKGVLLLLFVGAGWRAGLLPSKLRRRTPSIEQPTNG
jgi:O-antigen/teichoic acid export membrane protein